MKIIFNTDPSVTKIVIIAFLMFVEAIIGGILVVCNEGRLPTPVEWVTIICVGMMQLVTYLLTFLRKEE